MRTGMSGAIGVVASILLAGSAFTQGDRPVSWKDPVSQWATITFSHRFHIEDVEAECSDCHPGAPTSDAADDFLLPTHEECGGCHDVEEAEECGMCHGDGGIRQGFAVPARTILFSHQAHLEGLGLECSLCHRGVRESEGPSVANLPAMEGCVGCHDELGAPQACEACHLDVETLLPLSHRESDWGQEHQRRVRVGGGTDPCATCHSEDYCQGCHVHPGLQLTGESPVRSLPEFRPMVLGKWTLALTNVHELDYRFRHSLDLRSKKSDCYVCHDQQAFCTECHGREQEAGFGSPVPFLHRDPDFVRIGVGSGGGGHADQARRDIEACASCHDVEGRDPVCILCHVDRIPGRGNDPRTHASDFRNEDGEWHGNPGSVCFNCHTDTGQAGAGFCGYCHGAED